MSQDVYTIRAGLVGCGGRGTGAAENILTSSPGVEVVGLADLFPDRLERCRGNLAKTRHPGFKVEEKNCYTGLDAFKRLLETDINTVLLCEPPGFRPEHFAAAIDAGKHVFFEKPVAVDPVGVRKVIEVGERAKEKKLAVVAGTHLRHSPMFKETIRRVHEGAIGKVVAGRAYFNTGALWKYVRKPGEDDYQWQVRNWYYLDWLSGDHIVEQHVHTIDITDWVMGARPVRATGVGGRQVRVEQPQFGNIWDHFLVDYEYPGGVHVASMCRQWAGTPGNFSAQFTGTEGGADPFTGTITGANPWKFEGKEPRIPHVQEHTDLVESIRKGEPLNDARQVAESTLTAILGREAAYTGKTITWKEMMDSKLDLSPPKQEFGPLAVREVPVPGRNR